MVYFRLWFIFLFKIMMKTNFFKRWLKIISELSVPFESKIFNLGYKFSTIWDKFSNFSWTKQVKDHNYGRKLAAAFRKNTPRCQERSSERSQISNLQNLYINVFVVLINNWPMFTCGQINKWAIWTSDLFYKLRVNNCPMVTTHINNWPMLAIEWMHNSSSLTWLWYLTCHINTWLLPK